MTTLIYSGGFLKLKEAQDQLRKHNPELEVVLLKRLFGLRVTTQSVTEEHEKIVTETGIRLAIKIN